MPHYATHQDLEALERRLMSAITPDLAKLATAVDAVLADLETLKANAVTQADKDTIAAMQGKIEAALAPVVVPAGTGN